MTRKAYTLRQLVDVARTRADVATRALGVSQTRAQEETAKLELLLGYRSEYQARFEAAARNGLDPAQWRNFQMFMEKLDGAIRQQHEIIANSNSQLDTCRGDWHSANRKVKSYDTLVKREEHGAARTAARHEQNEQDEAANRIHLGTAINR